MRISDLSSDVCSSDLFSDGLEQGAVHPCGGFVEQNEFGVGHQHPPEFKQLFLATGQIRSVFIAYVGQLQIFKHLAGLGIVPGFFFSYQRRTKYGAPEAFPMLAWRHEHQVFEHAHGAVFTRDLERAAQAFRSEEHTSELQSLMRISYAVFCLQKKKTVRNS